jgi:NADH dehydrogenase subunit B (EC 1.6.5.3)
MGIEKETIEIAPGIRQVPGTPVVVSPIDKIINWARAGSMWPVTFGLACCAIEMMATGASHFDLDRYGIILEQPLVKQMFLLLQEQLLKRWLLL